MDFGQLPPTDDRLAWLAILQHYGGPTRLLDFTYSPYIALYFALRDREDKESEFVDVWGIDEPILREQAERISRDADRKIRDRKLAAPVKRKVSFAPDDAISSLQLEAKEEQHLELLVRNALDPCGTRRNHFNREGFIATASPPVQNPRLSSQQGVFLLNGAEGSTFERSLEMMMSEVKAEWYRRFRVPATALKEIEQELFQFNIHDLSLFPDIEGLARFVRQKVRLHW